MKTFRYINMAVLGLMMAACSNDLDLEQTVNESHGIPFSATISVGNATRTSLTENANKTINMEWVNDEQVAMVYVAGGALKVTAATVTVQTDKSATISATLEEGVADGANVRIISPYSAVDKDGEVRLDLFKNQAGTLDGIATNCNLLAGSGKLTLFKGKATLDTDVKMESQVAIWKLSLSDGADALKTSKLSLMIGDEELASVKPVTPTNELYMAMMPIGDTNPTLKAIAEGETYTYYKEGVTLAAGKYYQSSVKMKPVTVNLAKKTGDYTAVDGDVLKGTLDSKYRLVIPDGCTVTFDGVDINYDGVSTNNQQSSVTCLGAATIILADGSENKIGVGTDEIGATIQGNFDNMVYKPLTIKGETEGTGTLLATGMNGFYCVDLIIDGGNLEADCGSTGIMTNKMVVNSGTVKAHGKAFAIMGSIGLGYGLSIFEGDAPDPTTKCTNQDAEGLYTSDGKYVVIK